MKKKMTTYFTFIGVLFIVGCSNGNNSEGTNETTVQTSQAEQINVTVDIEERGQTIGETEVETTTDESLMQVMRNNFAIKEENGMIVAVEGVEQDEEENLYWTYTINDEMVNTGAEDTTLEDSDQVTFTYDEME